MPRLPPWGRLEQVALHLAERQQYRNVIVFVEAWAGQASPTLPARLALCEAYLGLRMVDRAWSRLEPLVDEGSGPLAAVRLAAYYHLLKGWPERARAIAEAGLSRAPEDPDLRQLIRRSHQPLAAPSPTEGTLSSMIRTAEHYLTGGAQVKAQAMLERARRHAKPRRVQRVEDLLWAMLGDTSPDMTVAEMCDAWAPEDPAVEATERLPGTASATSSSGTDAARLEGFRQLFKSLGVPEPDSKGEEDTSVSKMAESTELQSGFAASTDAGENTEILRVVRRPGRGVSAPADRGSSDSDYHPGAEYEDDDLVVRTRQPPSLPPSRTPPSLNRISSDKQAEADARTMASAARGRTPGRARPRREARTNEGAGPSADEMQEPLWPWFLAAGVVLLSTMGVMVAVAALFGGR